MEIKCKNPVCQCVWKSEGVQYYCCPRCGDLQEVPFVHVDRNMQESLYYRIREFQRSWIRMDLIYALLWSFFCGFILFCMGVEFRVTDPAKISTIGQILAPDAPSVIVNLVRLRLAFFVLALIFLTCPYRMILGRLIWKDHYRFFFTRPGKMITWGLLLLFLGWCWFAEIPIYKQQMVQAVETMKLHYESTKAFGTTLRIAVMWTLFIRSCEEMTRRIMYKRCAELQP